MSTENPGLKIEYYIKIHYALGRRGPGVTRYCPWLITLERTGLNIHLLWARDVSLTQARAAGAVTPISGLSVYTHRALPLRRGPRAPGRPSQVDTTPENIYTMTENICRCFACCKRKPVTKIQMDIEPYFTTVHNLARSVKSSNSVIQIHILIKPSRNAMKCKWNANEMHFK